MLNVIFHHRYPTHVVARALIQSKHTYTPLCLHKKKKKKKIDVT